MAHLLPDGTQSTSEDKLEDARAWTTAFARDVFNNHCTNHEHDCTETCIKYVKPNAKKMTEKSLDTERNIACRFHYFVVKVFNIVKDGVAQVVRIKRRGKA